MKNILNYYYDLISDNIHQNDGNYFFDANNVSYAFVSYNRNLNEIDDIYKLTLELYNKRIPVHQLVMNKENNFITYYNEKPYLLLKIYKSNKNNIDIEDIESLSNFSINVIDNEKLRRDNWANMWEEKMDYFEYQVNQFGKKYPNIRDSFCYFEGLVENGISLFNNIKLDYKKLFIQHRRLNDKSEIFDFYNPLNLIIDYRVRDACEYFKYKFLKKNDLYFEIKEYLSSNNLTQYEIIMFFVRMFYPSFYFDFYEEILENEKDDYEIKKIILLTDKYELILKKTYEFISNYVLLPDIEWIKKT